MSALRHLIRNNEFAITPTDKNLGLEVMDTTTYIKQVLIEHLLAADCRQLLQTKV